MGYVEGPFILALIGALSGGVANWTLPRVTERRAASVCMNARPGEPPPPPTVLRRAYGWGSVQRQVLVCLPVSTATSEEPPPSSRREVWRDAHDDRFALAASAVLHALLMAWVASSLALRRRELLEMNGHDVPVEARDGYREPVRVRRELPAGEPDPWKGMTTVAAVVWGLSTAVVAWAGSGQAMLPMPWALTLWSALSLPGAVAYVRWQQLWGVGLLPIGAAAIWLGGPWACAWVAIVSAVFSVLTWSEAQLIRRDWLR